MSVLNFFLFLLLVVSNQGCAILNHLDELSMMGDYSRDKDDQHKRVILINQRYDALLTAVSAKQMGQYANQADIRTTFGEPILIKEILVDGQKQEQWLYRKALIKDAKDKVYLYFNDKGSLIKYEQEPILW